MTTKCGTKLVGLCLIAGVSMAVSSAASVADIGGSRDGDDVVVTGLPDETMSAAPPATTPVPAIAVGPSGVDEASIIAYLETLDTVDASPALAVASPRSAAWRYAEHQVAYEVACRENGVSPSADVISPRGPGQLQSCPTR